MSTENTEEHSITKIKEHDLLLELSHSFNVFLIEHQKYKPLEIQEALIKCIEEIYQIFNKPKLDNKDWDFFRLMRSFLWYNNRIFNLCNVDFEKNIKPKVTKEAYDFFLHTYGTYADLPCPDEIKKNDE